jgi:hypothetical protein
MEQEIKAMQEREMMLYPTLFFKDQLVRLEAVADESGEAVAKLVRKAIDAFLAEKRAA